MRALRPALAALCGARGAAVTAPFGQTAIAVASLKSLEDCEKVPFYDLGSEKCEVPREAVVAWQYALSNARRQMEAFATSKEAGAHKEMAQDLLNRIVSLQRDISIFLKDEPKKKYTGLMKKVRKFFHESLVAWLSDHGDVELAPDHALLRSGARAALAFPQADGRGLDGERGLGNATIALADGVDMPLVGFGTWQMEGKKCDKAVAWALQAGYRHLDTAQSYENEKCVGAAIAGSGVPREQLFVVTKLSDEKDFTEKRAVKALGKQLESLRTSYVDVYMLHSPSDRSRKQTLAAWRGLEKLHAEGKARALGVSNFMLADLAALLKVAKVQPVYIQNKLSIYHHGGEDVASKLQALIRERGIHLVGYSVINPWPGILDPLQDPHVQLVAKRVGRTPSQVLHRWALQLGAAVIPKSVTQARIAENADLFSFSLADEDIALLTGLAELVHGAPRGKRKAKERKEL